VFFYGTHLRFQGIFDSPNTCAVLLGMTLVFILVFFKKKQHWSLRIPAISAVCFFSYLLAQTYSRGTWVAYGCSLVLLLFLARGFRIPVIWIILAFALGLLLLPAGTERILSSGNFQEGSVRNRLVVYQGATTVIYHQPLTGVGWDQFGPYYKNWFQPADMKYSYPGALNNYLCLAAELGLPALWLYLVIIWSSIVCSSWLAVRTQSLLVASLAAAQVCFQVAGQFTYTLTLKEISWVSPLVLAVAAGQLFVVCRRKKLSVPVKTIVPVVSVAAALLCGGIYAAGGFFAGQLPERVTFFDHRQAVWVAPNSSSIRAAVVYSMDRGENIQKLGRDTLRYLAKHGIASLSVNSPSNDANPIAQISGLIEKARAACPDNTPVWVFGINSGTRPALAAASRAGNLAGVILLGSPYEWPEESLSPRRNLAGITCPLYLIHGQYNFLVPYQEGLKLKAEAERLNIPVNWRLLPDHSHYFTASEWRAILDDVVATVLIRPVATP
jgi:pimeloyl-ACP methyl ester carboxylesterase